MYITIQIPILHLKCENKMIANVTTSKRFMSTDAEITTFHLILWWPFQILQYKKGHILYMQHCCDCSGNNTSAIKCGIAKYTKYKSIRIFGFGVFMQVCDKPFKNF